MFLYLALNGSSVLAHLLWWLHQWRQIEFWFQKIAKHLVTFVDIGNGNFSAVQIALNFFDSSLSPQPAREKTRTMQQQGKTAY